MALKCATFVTFIDTKGKMPTSAAVIFLLLVSISLRDSEKIGLK